MWLRLLSGLCAAVAGGFLTIDVQAARIATQQPGATRAPLQTVEAAQMSGTTRYAIDYLDDGIVINLSTPHVSQVTVATGTPLLIGGWAIDSKAAAAAGGVLIYIDGRERLSARYGVQRPDVARALHSSKFTSSGFTATIPTSNLTAGVHVLTFQVVTANRKAVYQVPTKIAFTVVKTVPLAALRRLNVSTALYVDYVVGSRLVLMGPKHGTVSLRRGQNLVIGGWAIDSRAHSVAGAVIVSIDNKQNLQSFYRLRRPDVAKQLRNTAYTNTGFQAIVPTGYLVSGWHYFSIEVLSKAGNAYYPANAKYGFLVKS